MKGLRSLLITALASAAPAAAALAALPLRTWVPSADVAVVLVGIVVVAGAAGHRSTPAVAAVSAALAFDVWWTRPYGSLAVLGAGDRLSGVVVLIVGAGLAWRSRRRPTARIARARARASYRHGDGGYLRTLARLAGDIAAGDDAGLIILDVARNLVELLDLRDCIFELAPLAPTLRPVLIHSGELELCGVCWSPSQVDVPPTGFDVLVVARGRVEGRFTCLPRAPRRLRAERCLMSIAFVDQAAAALLVASAA